MSLDASAVPRDSHSGAARFAAVRQFTEQLSEPLSPEDCTIQSMPDASPTRWHLAHTTWFFETFILAAEKGYHAFNPDHAILFNSYYNSIGDQFPRSKRGVLSRPSLVETLAYRRYVDEQILEKLQAPGGVSDRLEAMIEIGLHHEQQHQELILTDIKHAFSCNPSPPVYRDGTFAKSGRTKSTKWLSRDEGIYRIGHDETSFSFDNETPRHYVFLESFKLNRQLVTCGEYLKFMEDGGYTRPELWLSLGWQTVCDQNWEAPLYWYQQKGKWSQFTLAGPRAVDPNLPVCHVSLFRSRRLCTLVQSSTSNGSRVGTCV